MRRIIAKVQEWLGHANVSTTRLYDRRKMRPEFRLRVRRGAVGQAVDVTLETLSRRLGGLAHRLRLARRLVRRCLEVRYCRSKPAPWGPGLVMSGFFGSGCCSTFRPMKFRAVLMPLFTASAMSRTSLLSASRFRQAVATLRHHSVYSVAGSVMSSRGSSCPTTVWSLRPRPSRQSPSAL